MSSHKMKFLLSVHGQNMERIPVAIGTTNHAKAQPAPRTPAWWQAACYFLLLIDHHASARDKLPIISPR